MQIAHNANFANAKASSSWQGVGSTRRVFAPFPSQILCGSLSASALYLSVYLSIYLSIYIPYTCTRFCPHRSTYCGWTPCSRSFSKSSIHRTTEISIPARVVELCTSVGLKCCHRSSQAPQKVNSPRLEIL